MLTVSKTANINTNNIVAKASTKEPTHSNVIAECRLLLAECSEKLDSCYNSLAQYLNDNNNKVN